MANPSNVFVASGYLYMNDKTGYKGDESNHGKDFMWNLKLRVRRNFKNANGEYDTDFLPLKISGYPAYFTHSYLKSNDAVTIVGEIRMDGEIRDKDTNEITRYAQPTVFVDNIMRAPVNNASSEDADSSSNNVSNATNTATKKKPTFNLSKLKSMNK